MGDKASAPGRLIAICGIDGCGKATQAELLAHRARSEGLSVQLVSFPRYGQGFFGELIERYLRGEFAASAAEVNPYLASLPYACDRWEAGPQLRRWIEAGHLVLCNRYVPANLAHQGSKIDSAEQRRAFFDWEERLEYEVFALPRPDLQLLLDVPPEQADRLLRRRNKASGGAGHDIHETDMTHLASTAETYRELAASGRGRWATVACMEVGTLLSPEQIAEKVWTVVQEILYDAPRHGEDVGRARR
jgi:dTMP kinase